MHLVGALLHPLEESLDAIPVVILPEFLAGEIHSLLSLDHELPISLRQLLKGKVDIDIMGRAGTKKVTLAVARLTALEGLH